jgi:hypothetical protein
MLSVQEFARSEITFPRGEIVLKLVFAFRVPLAAPSKPG